MALKALKCPSCGANISLDDNREFGFCLYCGSKIQVGEQINIHVTHEFKGESPNVTNNYYYDNYENVTKSHVIIEKPRVKKMVWGIIFAIIGIIGLCSGNGKSFAYMAVCLAMIVVSALLFVSYFRSMRVYHEAVRNASKNGSAIYDSKDCKHK